MDLTKLHEIQSQRASLNLSDTRHKELLAYNARVADSVLSATQSLINYLEGHTADVTLTNPTTEVATPDVRFVVEALQVLNASVASIPVTDLSEVVSTLQAVLAATKQLPTDHADIVIPDSVSVSNQIDNTKDLKALLTAVKAIKLTAEAPIVNVPETKIDVAAPDLSPITTEAKAITKQVKLSTEQLEAAANKTQSGLITEQFDEYKISYRETLDDNAEAQVKSITYKYKNKVVAQLKYSYDKKGNLLGGKKQ